MSHELGQCAPNAGEENLLNGPVQRVGVTFRFAHAIGFCGARIDPTCCATATGNCLRKQSPDQLSASREKPVKV